MRLLSAMLSVVISPSRSGSDGNCPDIGQYFFIHGHFHKINASHNVVLSHKIKCVNGSDASDKHDKFDQVF